MKDIKFLKTNLLNRAKEAADYIRSQNITIPEVVVILGSGLKILEDIENPSSLQYSQIPYFPEITVVGHSGTFTTGSVKNKAVGILRGRFHFYEGYEYQDVLFPVTVMAQLGVKSLILTNAAGGLNRNFNVGDLMLITDHFNFQSGIEPLITEVIHDTDFYNADLCNIMRKAAIENSVKLNEGVYLCAWGPTYETPAELAKFMEWGADAVGMSTVPEAIWGKYLGMNVAAVSCITNIAYTTKAQASASHEEVVDVAKAASLRLNKIITGMFDYI